MGAVFPLVVVGFTVATTVVFLLLALTAPGNRSTALFDDEGHPRIRLLSRILFTRANDDAITLDCLLVSVDQAGPGISAPEGLPFTLRLRAPETAWFADRVQQLLGEWADDSREMVVELREDHGKVRTMLSSGESAVHLELAGAAGLSLTS
jgi:hypothetical protein